MADISSRETAFKKDKKVQVYYVETKMITGTTKKAYYRHFIYPKATYDKGGLWCYVRDLSSSETISINLSIDKHNVKFRFNHNHKITNECKIIFRNKVYSISGEPDNYEFNSKNDTIVNAIETGETTKFESDIYDEGI